MTEGTTMPAEREAIELCPFCKSTAKHIERHNPMSKWRHSVDCDKCGASGPVEATKAEAIAAWNTRTTSLAAQDVEWTDFDYKTDKEPEDRAGGWQVTWASGLVENISSFRNVNYAHVVKYRPARTTSLAAQDEWEDWASDNWREQGYKTAAEEVQDMAAVGRSFMERYVGIVAEGGEMSGFTPLDDPAELVTDMANEIAELRASLAAQAGLVDALRRARRTVQWAVYQHDIGTPYRKTDEEILAQIDAALASIEVKSDPEPERSALDDMDEDDLNDWLERGRY